MGVSTPTTYGLHTEDNNTACSRDDRPWAMSHERWHIRGSLRGHGPSLNERGSISSCRKHAEVMRLIKKRVCNTDHYLTSSSKEHDAFGHETLHRFSSRGDAVNQTKEAKIMKRIWGPHNDRLKTLVLYNCKNREFCAMLNVTLVWGAPMTDPETWFPDLRVRATAAMRSEASQWAPARNLRRLTGTPHSLTNVVYNTGHPGKSGLLPLNPNPLRDHKQRQAYPSPSPQTPGFFLSFF